MENIEESLQKFRNLLENLNPNLTSLTIQNYLALKRHLLEAQMIPVEQIINWAKYVKPLVRLTAESRFKKIQTISDYKVVGQIRTTDILVWTKPIDLQESFYFAFNENSIVKNSEGQWLPVKNLRKVSEFVCYHKYGGYYGFLRPDVNEVLRQFPKGLQAPGTKSSLGDETTEGFVRYAFEVLFPSRNIEETYDPILDCHVSTVILYQMKEDYPIEVSAQDVIYDGKTY